MCRRRCHGSHRRGHGLLHARSGELLHQLRRRLRKSQVEDLHRRLLARVLWHLHVHEPAKSRLELHRCRKRGLLRERVGKGSAHHLVR